MHPARDLMTREGITFAPETPVAEIARLMSTRKVHTLPLAGIVGKMGSIRGLA